MIQKLWTVYTINDPHSDDVVYVGITNGNVLRRFGQHLQGSRHNPELSAWMISFEDQLLMPALKIVTKVKEEEHARLVEGYLIAQLKRGLFNKTKPYVPKGSDFIVKRLIENSQPLRSSLSVDPAPRTTKLRHVSLAQHLERIEQRESRRQAKEVKAAKAKELARKVRDARKK